MLNQQDRGGVVDWQQCKVADKGTKVGLGCQGARDRGPGGLG